MAGTGWWRSRRQEGDLSTEPGAGKKEEGGRRISRRSQTGTKPEDTLLSFSVPGLLVVSWPPGGAMSRPVGQRPGAGDTR